MAFSQRVLLFTQGIQEAKFVLTTCGNTWVSASNAETADSELEIQSWHRTQKDCNCSEG
ncbi:Hypothetical predicted protein [Olea europaea subsp. europaea]|uniref:Uncharacterized protein n=1 Tax=Olea europaea subsp. europaea TaxID=158383 RepID=A0A8S0TIB3_OLEEU|nr:Hypothetical predicted protein [Olea europaea subsp. europaea]